MRLLPLLFLLFGWFPALSTALLATPVFVGDHSFEGNGLARNQWTNNLEPEWKETDGPDNGNGFEEHIQGFSAQGNNHLGMESNHNVWQNLAETYEANTRYTLTVAVGHRNGVTQPGNDSVYELGTSDDTYHAFGSANAFTLTGAQTFANAPPLVLNTSEHPEIVGKNIRIMLRARGAGRSHFDLIRLDAESSTVVGAPVFQSLSVADITSTGATVTGALSDVGAGTLSLAAYWGTSDGGANAANWESSTSFGPGAGGNFSVSIGALAPGTTWQATVRATNAAGSSWWLPALAFETLPSPPQVETLAANDITASSAVIAARVTATGGETPQLFLFHGLSDGGTDPASWDTSTPLGTLAEGGTTLSSLASGTTYYFRAFAENSGGGAWAAGNSSFTTLIPSLPGVVNHPATGITGTSASLRGEVTDAGNDPSTILLYHGTTDGGTDPGAWDSSVDLGLQGGSFERLVGGLSPLTTYYYRSRASNLAGASWATGTASFTTPEAISSSLIITEFHYKPGDESSLEEFIEVHNPGDSPVDLSGWSLADAVSFTFPPGTLLAAGGYLVAGEDPATLLARYGVTALGPWNGKLSSAGEIIQLRDPEGNIRDHVSYLAGFPWPSAADGGGSSVELIHPSLDRTLAGSWRASGAGVSPPTVYIPAQSSGWKYRKGTQEASSPVAAWRATAFNDSSWFNGTTGIGYGDNGLQTILSDMRNNYASVYFRRAFTIPAGAVPDRLKLRISIDDGCVIWLNGVEIDRRHVGGGQLAFNYLAPANHEQIWEEVIIENADELLFGGTNVIAVHGFNTSLGSSDFSMDLELLSAGTADSALPTPAAANSVATDIGNIPPQVQSATHSPQSPAVGEAVTITSRITDPDGMGLVTLSYQTVDPGAYIKLTAAAYTTNWTEVPMRDDGMGGDAVAGDSIFTAILPGNLQTHRRLVRYRVTARDAIGNSVTVPYSDDEQPNFAYYISNGTPAWQGAFRPGQTPVQSYPPELLDELPTYTLIANSSDVINSQYNSGSNKQRFHGTFVYNGEVFDHIGFRNRGEASTYVSGKNKWRFYFNRGRRLQAMDNDGAEYSELWKNFSGDACSSPWAALHRGIAGVEEAASYRIYQLAGVPSPKTHYYHFRVVRGANEAPPTGSIVNDPIGNADGQYAGDFWGLYLAVEPIRGNFLDERGLPDGNIYKIENNAGDKKEQAPGQPLDSSDWNAFRDAHVNGNPTEAWWRANMDMDAYYTFQALNRLVGNVDLRGGFNHYFYHRSSDNRWVPIPWDLDMMFIAKSHWTTSISGTAYPGVIHAHKAILQHPALALEYRNRCREILDLMASDATRNGGQIGQLLGSLADIVSPAGQSLTWANADAAMWNLHPRTQGSDSNNSGQTNHRGNFFRGPFNDSRFGGGWTRWIRSPSFTGTGNHTDLLQYFADYSTNTWPGGTWTVNNGQQLGYGYQYLLSESADPAIPQRPVLVHAGSPDYSYDNLRLEASAFADPQGLGTFAARQWRLSELSGSGQYEIDALWTATTTDSAATTLNLPTTLAIPGRNYRARVRQQDSSGRWSHWSAPLAFTAGQSNATLVHYWNFNDPSDLVSPSLGNGSFITYATTSATEITSGSGQGFSAANAAHGDPAETHLRVNNPLGSSMTFTLPSTNYQDLVARVETRRSGQGAGIQSWSYTVDGSTFIPLGEIVVLNEDPRVIEFDFRTLPATWDNPAFAMKVNWNQGSGGIAGNNRFDNFTLTGNVTGDANFPPVPQNFADLVNLIEGGGPVTINPAAFFTDPEDDALVFALESARPGVVSRVELASGDIELFGLQRGESMLTLSADDGRNPPVIINFRALVHPAAHRLADGDFAFGEWDPSTPARVYPQHMLFLQSAMDDPGVDDLLEYAYDIPQDDYAAADAGSIGFPYNNSARTRITGLGSDGISLINTGRGRDLGGALLSLDTRGADDATIRWTAGTRVANSRSYALRLQYRIGNEGPFNDLLDGTGNPLVYQRSEITGDVVDLPPAALPTAALGQAYVQLLWKYHHLEGDTGPRDELRLDDLSVTRTTSPPLTGSYAEWAALQFTPEQLANPAISGPEADPDGDGTPNFLEFALASSPLAADSPQLTFARIVTAGVTLDGIRFQRPTDAAGILYELLTSDDMQQWDSVPAATFDVLASSDGIATVIASDPAPPGQQKFLRLRITLLPGSP